MFSWNDIIRFANKGNPAPPRRVVKSEQEWSEILSKDEFLVTRQKGTEKSYSSEMCSLFEPGKYVCKCCNTYLFDASEKFDSETGWPSFTSPAKETHVAYHKDKSYGTIRVEATCNICDAHLGHVFPDGPEPGGLRFCINAFSLRKQVGGVSPKVRDRCGIYRDSNPCGDASDY